MFKTHRPVRGPSQLITLFFTCACIQASAQVPSIVESLPADTCAWFHVNDFQGWNKAFDDSQFQNVLNQKVFRPFAETWHAYTESPPYALEYGLNVSEFDRLARKGFVVAWLPFGKTMNQIAIVETKDEALVDELLKTAAARYAKNGYEESAEKGWRIFASGDKKVIIGHRDGRFVVGHDMEAVSAVFQSGSRLADDAGFQFVRKNIGKLDGDKADVRLNWYCAPWRLLNHSPSPPANLPLMIEQGFASVDGLGGVFDFTPKDIVSYRFVAHLQEPLRDSAVALRSRPVAVDLPDWLVSRTRGVQVAGLDEHALLEGYGKWFDATEGEGEEGLFDLVLDEIRDEPDAPGVDLRKELVDQVASSLYVVRPRSKKGDLPVVMVVKAKQIEVVRRAIGRMLEGDPDVEKITVGNVPAWQFGDLTANGTRQVLGPDLSEVTVCVYRDYLLASSKAESIAALVSEEKASDGKATRDGLLAIKKFAATVTENEPGQSLIGYRFAQSADWFAQGYDRFRSAELIETDDDTTFLLGNIAVTFFNRLVAGPAKSAFLNLPPRSVAQKHFGIAMDVLHTSNQDGWVATGVIRPPAP